MDQEHETHITKRIAAELGGEDQYHYQDGDSWRKVDIMFDGCAIEYDSTEAEAIKDATKRIGAFPKVVALWYEDGRYHWQKMSWSGSWAGIFGPMSGTLSDFRADLLRS